MNRTLKTTKTPTIIYGNLLAKQPQAQSVFLIVQWTSSVQRILPGTYKLAFQNSILYSIE